VNKTYETNILNGVFGSLRDSSPDYWGRRVIEKRSGQAGLGEVDYLLYSPDDRAGALGFGRNASAFISRRTMHETSSIEPKLSSEIAGTRSRVEKK
jgi:serine/threonine-protein kinase HipA